MSCGYGCCSACLEGGVCFLCALEHEAALVPTRTASAFDRLASQHVRIAVLGAGIVGSFFALLMAKRGFEIDVFDLSDHIGTWRGVININAPGLRLLERAGLLDAVLAEHRKSERATFWDGGLRREVLRYDLPSEGKRYSLPGYSLTCERRKLLQQLRSAATVAGARFHFDARATSVTSSDDEVAIEFADRPHFTADFLIGADGVHSLVRRSLFAAQPAPSLSAAAIAPGIPGGGPLPLSSTLPPKSTGHWACNGLARGVALPEAIARSDQAELWGPEGCFLIFQYKDGLIFWATLQRGVRPPRLGEGASLEEEQRRLLLHLRSKFGTSRGFHPVADALMAASEPESVYAYQLGEVRQPRWHRGRVLLIGDAAHAMCNRLGAGGCTGLEDAHASAELVALCLRAAGGQFAGEDGDRSSSGDGGTPRGQAAAAAATAAVVRAFALVERRRKHRARRIQHESMILARLTVLLAPFAGWRVLRNATLRLAGWLPTVGGPRVPIFDFLNNYRVSLDSRLVRPSRHG